MKFLNQKLAVPLLYELSSLRNTIGRLIKSYLYRLIRVRYFVTTEDFRNDSNKFKIIFAYSTIRHL